MDKKKILFISDHPLYPSGVGTQAKYLIEGLLETGKFKFFCLAGAIKHSDYRPGFVDPEKYGQDWFIVPIDGYGDRNRIRTLLLAEKPDAVVIFTDPRFFVWLWEMEDEVRQVCPLIYWHVWDNDPTPKFNKVFYDSTDYIGALSLKTFGLLDDLGYDKSKFSYIPHAIDAETFKPLPEDEVASYKNNKFGPHRDKRFIVFWNNRNARRKKTGDVIDIFSKFAAKVGKQNVALMMHTDVKDQEGQDIIAVSRNFGVEENMIISQAKIPPEDMCRVYNVVDCTMNISEAEGFGLATLESLFCGTPTILHMTGGLQFQIGDWWKKLEKFTDQNEMADCARKLWRKPNINSPLGQGEGNWWGVPIFPASRSCTGSQQIPYIYEDRVNHDDVVNALVKLYEMGRTKRRELGRKAREWVAEEFKMQKMIDGWDKAISTTIDRFKTEGVKKHRVERI